MKERDPAALRAKLRHLVLSGYSPDRSAESAEDHWADWFVLEKTEFDQIKSQAERDRPLEPERRLPFGSPWGTPHGVRLLVATMVGELDGGARERVLARLSEVGINATAQDLEVFVRQLVG